MSEQEFYLKAADFLDRLLTEMRNKQIDIKHWDIDHVCYRVETIERYEELKISFAQFADLLVESNVNGRPIATFKLHAPLYGQGRRIDVVELPAPKKSKKVAEGFEHIEIVAEVPLTKLSQTLQGFYQDIGGLKKSFNPELEISLSNGAVKFHPLSLESVVRLEKNKPIFNALVNSRVLEILRAHDPVVAGTFPLGLQTERSDLDILITTTDQVETKELLEENFGQFPGFQTHFKLRQGLPTLTGRFEFEGVMIEIFGQEKPSVEQYGYRHFLVEERLLKLGGEKFRAQVIERRNAGLKTEPAFADVLGLPGNPYEALLELQTKTDVELISLIPG